MIFFLLIHEITLLCYYRNCNRKFLYLETNVVVDILLEIQSEIIV